MRALGSARTRVAHAAAGYGHTLFVTRRAAAVFGCGYNEFGQVGVPAEGASAVLVPRRLRALRGARVTAVSCGENHSAAVVEPPASGPGAPDKPPAASVYTWGLNLTNQCAHGRTVDQLAEPTPVPLLTGAKRVVCGAAHTLVVM